MSEIVENHFEGCGKIIQTDNYKYWGQHKLWIKEGFGTSEEPSFESGAKGRVYQGEWKDNCREGYGICNYPDGSMYQGEWKDDKREGKGFFRDANGTETKGPWKND